MRTSHKLTRLILAIMTLVSLAGAAVAQQLNAEAVPVQPVPVEATNISAVGAPTLNMPMFPSPQPPGFRGNWNNENTNFAPPNRAIGFPQVPNQADPPAQVQVSDQKLGSLVVFPYYISNAAGTDNTWVTLSNVSNSAVTVHIFFLERGCSQADQFICLTANASWHMRASDFDPGVTGWILAVAVDANGLPIQKNVLSGNAFVNAVDSQGGGSFRYIGNYGAESFTAYNDRATVGTVNAPISIPLHAAAFAGDPMCRVKLEDNNNQPAITRDYISQHGYNANNYVPGLYTNPGGGVVDLNFTGPPTFCSAYDTNKEPGTGNLIHRTFQLNGGGYDFVPNRFAVEIQSPVDVEGQKVVTVGMTGDLSTGGLFGAQQIGTGTVINGDETPFGSFVRWILGNCYATARLNNTELRVPRGIDQLIPSGKVGTMQFGITAGVGLIMTPVQAANKKPVQGIRTLHKIGLNTAAAFGANQTVTVEPDAAGAGGGTVSRGTISRYGVSIRIPVFLPPVCR